MLLTKGIIKADILASKRAIEDFEETRIRDIKNIAAYHLQQAAEKLIKLQIYSKSTNVSNSRMYTHNLTKLIEYADSLNIRIDIPEFVRERSALLTDWEAGSRYDVSFSVRIDVLKKTFGINPLVHCGPESGIISIRG